MRATTLLFVALVAACAAPEKSAIPLEPPSPPEPARSQLRLQYNFSDYDYEYARAVALERTNLEPSPTSYVLFNQARLEEPLEDLTKESLAAAQKSRTDHLHRIKAYCLEHYKQFEDVPAIYESDPFGNFVTFYWLLEGSESDIRAALGDDDLDARCAFLAEHYDFGRAEALLGTLEGGVFKENPGPVLVLDLGFDAVVVPFDDVETEDMERVPPIWKQSIDRTLASVHELRLDDLEALRTIERRIAELDARATDLNVKRGERKRAATESGERRTERKGLLKRLFSKGSWGRAIVCGFSGSLLKVAGNYVPRTDALEAKMAAWCAPKDSNG